MSAQTRNDSRYERQAHAHLLQAHDLTTSTYWIPLRPMVCCGGIGTVWGSSPPKQSLFHRNFGGTRQSGGAGHAPESVSRFEASEWDEISAESLNRKVCPGLRPYSGMHFPPRTSNGNCSPQFGRKVGCSFPGLGKERRLRRLSYSPSSAFSGVMGSERTWWPVACATAEATAASGVLMTTSPIDLAPNGPVGS